MIWSACLNRPYRIKFLKAVFHKFHLIHSWIPCSMCVTKSRAIFRELFFVATSVIECLCLRIQESSSKLCKILAIMKYYRKCLRWRIFLKKSLPWKLTSKWPKFDACEGVYFLAKLKSEVSIQTFQNKHDLNAEHISFSLFWFSLNPFQPSVG